MTANGAGLVGFASVNYHNLGFMQTRLKGMHIVLKNMRKACPAEMMNAATGDKRQQMLRTQQKPV